MSPRVTAIVVARNGAAQLPRTLEAILAQTLRPDAVIVVDCGSSDATPELLAEFRPTHLITAGEDLPFGTAIATAVRVTAPPTSDSELLWLLAQDNAPEPGALAALVAALETAPSVAVAGPKQMDWEVGHVIRSFGASMTRYGATVPLVADELDQGQYDDSSDVLAVAAGGMLVRHRVWEALEGFDPGLPVVDDALDFCVRVRLAGHRVSVAPGARVATAGAGIAGANTSTKGRLRRRRLRLQRTAQLHRRLVYAPAAVVPLHWLALVPLAIVRSISALLGKYPGAIGGEIAAAFSAAFSGIRTSSARRRLARTRTLGWSVIAPLRVPPAEMRRRRALVREARIAYARGNREEIGFFSTGGAWTLLAAIVVGLVVVAPLVGAAAVTGGGILPLSGEVSTLWENIGYGWRDIGVGAVGAADPFTVVLALLGSVTFWSPTAALLGLWLAAVPLAALGAWFAASRLTRRGSLRAIAAVLWMLSPTLLSSIADGRPAAVIAHLLLPWLVFAGFTASRSWASAATTALLMAAILACAPILAPALLIAWLVVLVTSGRGFYRVLGVPIPALALLTPIVGDQVLRGAWLAVVADPGVPLPGGTVSVFQLLLGFPSGAFGGWGPVIDLAGEQGLLPTDAIAPQLLLPILLAPLAILGLLALFLPGARAAIASLGLALLGFVTAVASTLVIVATTGDQVVPLWAGAPLSLYWLGITGAVVVGLAAIPRFSLVPAIAATVMFVLAVAPLALLLPFGGGSVRAGSERMLPAFVTAEADADARAGTLEIIPQPDGGILADLQRGSGTALDDQATIASTDTELSDDQAELAALAGNLASRSGLDAASALDERRIRFVLLAPPVDGADGEPTTEGTQTVARARSSLDANPVLVPVGTTAFGSLWRVDTDLAEAAPAAIPVDAGGWIGRATLILWAVVFGITLLLCIPTGVGREVDLDAYRRDERPDAGDRTTEDGEPDPDADDDAPGDSPDDPDRDEADGQQQETDVEDPQTVTPDGASRGDEPEPTVEEPRTLVPAVTWGDDDAR